MTTAEERLLALARQLPPGLVSDWRGTNHFELTDRSRGSAAKNKWFWLNLRDIVGDELRDDDEQGRRVGRLLDLAEAAARWAAEKKEAEIKEYLPLHVFKRKGGGKR